MNALSSLIAEAAENVAVEPCPGPFHFRLRYSRAAELRSAFEQHFAREPQSIPRLIHQVWIGPRRPPWKWIDSFRRELTARFPAWRHRLWREPDIDRLNLRLHREYALEERLHGQVDLLRYELLYQFGGVYIDADMLWLGKSLDPLLADAGPTGMFVGRECVESVANSVIGASAGNPLLDLTIQFLQRKYRTLRLEMGFEPWLATGPRFLTEALHGLPCRVFPAHYFYPVSWHGIDPHIDTTQFPDSWMLQYGYSTNGLSVE